MICDKLNRVQASGTTRKTVWGLGKERGTQAAIAEVVVEEKLIGGVELLTVSEGRRSPTPRLLSYRSL